MCPVCGIAGLYSPAGMPNPERVDAMRAALVHRGPDEGSTDVFGHCVLGHQRLKVIDLETGYQPVSNESGDVVAVFNGEAYNFLSLRDELGGHDVRGTGDTPILPHLYEESGPRFVERLHGMFAAALWDAGRERLVLARDRRGRRCCGCRKSPGRSTSAPLTSTCPCNTSRVTEPRCAASTSSRPDTFSS